MYIYTHALTHTMYRIVYISRMLQLDHVLGASRRPGKAYLDKSSARGARQSSTAPRAESGPQGSGGSGSSADDQWFIS